MARLTIRRGLPMPVGRPWRIAVFSGIKSSPGMWARSTLVLKRSGSVSASSATASQNGLTREVRYDANAEKVTTSMLSRASMFFVLTSRVIVAQGVGCRFCGWF